MTLKLIRTARWYPLMSTPTGTHSQVRAWANMAWKVDGRSVWESRPHPRLHICPRVFYNRVIVPPADTFLSTFVGTGVGR